MSNAGRRPVRAALVVVVALPLVGALLTGCSVRGTVVVLGDTLDVDLVVTYPDSADPDSWESAPCGTSAHFTSMTVLRETRTEVTWSCRYQGPARSFVPGILTHTDGHHAFLLGPWTDYAVDPTSPLTDLDVTVVFPGRVVAASGGTVSGTTVHFTEAGAASFAAVAEDGSSARGPSAAVIAGTAGALGGAGVGFALAWGALALRNRKR